jgi:hypothetical protein
VEQQIDRQEPEDKLVAIGEKSALMQGEECD